MLKKKTVITMNKSILFTALAMLATSFGFSQVDASNCRDGENVEYCTQHKKMNQLSIEHPELYQQYLDVQAEQNLKSGKPTATQKGVVYTIPVVFHVLHNGGIENISKEQIYDALDILNRDYRLLNNDANNVHADFQGLPADVEVEFALATKAPDGTCFNGITRTMSALSYQGDNGSSQVNAIKNGNDVYQGEWPPNRYMNVYICGEIGGAAGYTFNPFGGSSMYYNGIFVLHNYTGSIETSSVYTSRTLTHEVGHWLNLSHCWGGNNNPGNASSCSSDDGVTDTPNTIGVTSCNLNENSCGPRANVENYMDYSYCSKMFTPGQVTRMRTALNSTSTGRKNLWQASNLALVGADGNLTLCSANFTSDKQVVCSGDQIQFTDESFNSVNGWTWSFPGGVPATSTAQNPMVTYSTPGVYQVELQATDGSSSITETKVSYITVLDGASSLPFYESFESFSSLDNLTEWAIYNPGNNNKFELETTTGYNGTKCARLINYGQAGENSDELIASAVDLSSVTSAVTLSFRYSYRKRNSADDEWLKVFITADCGENWVQRKTLHGTLLSDQVVTSSWKPSSQADWTTVHMTNVTSAYWVNNFRYKFEFEGSGGNNFYLDDINIYLGSPSDEIVDGTSGLNELNKVSGLTMYPNPSEGELNVAFNVDNSEKVMILLTDVAGKVMQVQEINAAQGSNLVLLDTETFAQGSYFMTIKTANATETKQFIVK